MTTEKQKSGQFGERLVTQHCQCPRCKRNRTLRHLPSNFKCADVVCDFCGYLAQVKSAKVKDVTVLPKTVLGAAWGVQKERMDAGIYFPLFLVLVGYSRTNAIYYLSADLQSPEMFVPRKPLPRTARRAGWQGVLYDLRMVADGAIVRLR